MACDPTQCGLCGKNGLPILLTRYAIAPATVGAPEVAASDVDTDASISNTGMGTPSILLGKDTIYTRRLLRQGYVYMYDEARNEWTAYVVGETGFVQPFGRAVLALPSATMTNDPNFYPCDTRNMASAACIVIEEPEAATTVWIAFSDVVWTKAVLEKHQAPDFRKKHMRKFDVNAWTGAPEADHAAAPAEGVKQIVDLCDNIPGQHFAFSSDPLVGRIETSSGKHIDWDAITDHFGLPRLPSPVTDNQKAHETVLAQVTKLGPEQRSQYIEMKAGFNKQIGYVNGAHMITRGMKRVARDQYHGGVVLTLNDPTAIAADLAGWMHAKYQIFASEGERYRKLPAAADIAALRAGVTRDALESLNTSRIATHAAFGADGGFTPSVDVTAPTPEQRAQNEQLALQVWDKDYAPYLDTVALERFEKQLDQDLRTFMETEIKPLAQGHANWMQTGVMSAYFACNFDPTNLDHGAAYVGMVSHIVANTQKYADCQSLYDKWLDGEFSGKDTNIALRAFVLNHDEFADTLETAIKKATEGGSVDWKRIWKAIIADTAEVIAKVMKTPGDTTGAVERLIARLWAQFGGFSHKLLEFSAQPGRLNRAVAWLGAIQQRGFIPVTVVGTQEQLWEASKASIRKAALAAGASPDSLLVKVSTMNAVTYAQSQDSLENWRRYGIKQNRLAVISRQSIEQAFPPESQRHPDMLEQSRQTFAATNRIILGTQQMQELENSTAAYVVGAPLRAIATSTNGIVVALAFLSASEALEKAQKNPDFFRGEGVALQEAQDKYRAAQFSALAFIGRELELHAVSIVTHFYHAPALAETLGKKIAKIGKGLGIGLGCAAWAIALKWDIKRLLEALDMGERGLAAKYGVSGMLDFAAIVAVIYPPTFIPGLVLIGVIVGWGVYTGGAQKEAYIRDWLQRCTFADPSKSKKARWKSLEEETQAFLQATGADVEMPHVGIY